MQKVRKIADILKMPSIDSPRGSYTSMTVQDVLIDKYLRKRLVKKWKTNPESIPPIHIAPNRVIDKSGEYYGVGPIEGIHLNRLIMGNGHHRLKAAIAAGLTEINTTDDVWESGD